MKNIFIAILLFFPITYFFYGKDEAIIIYQDLRKFVPEIFSQLYSFVNTEKPLALIIIGVFFFILFRPDRRYRSGHKYNVDSGIWYLGIIFIILGGYILMNYN